MVAYRDNESKANVTEMRPEAMYNLMYGQTFPSPPSAPLPGRYSWVENNTQRGMICNRWDACFTREEGTFRVAYEWSGEMEGTGAGLTYVRFVYLTNILLFCFTAQVTQWFKALRSQAPACQAELKALLRQDFLFPLTSSG